MADNRFQAWVLRAGVSGFTAGCRALQPDAPQFGNLIKVRQAGLRLFGLLYDVREQDDPAARQLVLVDDLEPEMALDQRQYRLTLLEISVLLVGYQQEGGRIMYGFAPRPPFSLETVTVCGAAELLALTARLDYLPLLAQVDHIPVDELLVAHLTQAAAAYPPEARYPFLVGAGRALARLFNRDLARLESVLKRIRPVAVNW